MFRRQCGGESWVAPLAVERTAAMSQFASTDRSDWRTVIPSVERNDKSRPNSDVQCRDLAGRSTSIRRHSIARDGQGEEHPVPRPKRYRIRGRSNRLVLVPWISEDALRIALLLASSSVIMVARPSNSELGPRSCSPIRPRDLLDERNERPRVDGRRSIVGGSVGGDCHRLVPAP